MYKMSLVDLRIKPRQTCQHLHTANHTKPLTKIILVNVTLLDLILYTEVDSKPYYTTPHVK